MYSRTKGWVVPPFSPQYLLGATAALQHCGFFDEGRLELPVVHCLTKSLPKRCQYRNLTDIIAAYCSEHAYFDAWMRRLILCSLGGYYEHCSRQAPAFVDIRVHLLEGYFCTPFDAWSAWIHRNGYLVFYAIKELVTVLVPLDPALHTVLRRMYRWDEFEATCRAAMDRVRTLMCANHAKGCANLFRQVHIELTRVNGRQLPYLYKMPSCSFVKYAHDVLREARQIKYEDCIARATRGGGQSLAELLRDLDTTLRCQDDTAEVVRSVVTQRHLHPDVSHDRWLAVCGCTHRCEGIIATLRTRFYENGKSAASAAATLQQLGKSDFAALNYYVTCMYSLQAVRTYDMPAHWYTAQHVAGARGPDNTEYFVCKACCQFKAFVVRPNVHDHMLTATGHDRVILGDEGRLYCARRPSKTTRLSTTDVPTGARRKGSVEQKQFARRHRRAAEQQRCSVTELAPVCLHGRMLECYGHLYVICTRCTRPCPFDFLQHNAVGYECGRCGLNEEQRRAQRRATTCFFCGSFAPRQRRNWTSVHMEDGGHVLLCRRHGCGATRHVIMQWSPSALRAHIAQALQERPPRTRRRHRRR